jgi:hypothetical protein
LNLIYFLEKASLPAAFAATAPLYSPLRQAYFLLVKKISIHRILKPRSAAHPVRQCPKGGNHVGRSLRL